jgi:citrate synthase
MKNMIDVLREKERESEYVQRELENIQRAFEKAQHDIDVLRTAVQMCAENESEAAVALISSSS